MVHPSAFLLSKFAFLDLFQYSLLAMATKQETKEFAVIQTGGKQYLVSEGDTLKIEKIKGFLATTKDAIRVDYKVGDSIVFDKVLLVDNGLDTTIGDPFIKGAKVSAEIKRISRAKKVTVIKYKAKSNYFKKARPSTAILRSCH